MHIGRLRGLTSLVIFLVSAFVSMWGIKPYPLSSKSLSLPPSQSNILHLTWPDTIRKGDAADIHLAVEVDRPETYFMVIEDSGMDHLSGSYNLVAEARLEMPGLAVDPPGLVSQPLNPERMVTFNWSATGDRARGYTGSAWFYLRFIPVGEGEEQRMALSAQPLELRIVDLIGLDGSSARTLGFTGILAGILLGSDIWLNEIKRFLKRIS